MISTATTVVVLVGAFLLGVRLTVDLVKHRRRKVELGLGDVLHRTTMKNHKAGGKGIS